jgi:hypothetical protein
MPLSRARQPVAILGLVAMGFATVGIHIVHPLYHPPFRGCAAVCQRGGHGLVSHACGLSDADPHPAGQRPDASLRSDDATRRQRLHGPSTCPICQLLASTFKMACQVGLRDSPLGLSALPKARFLPQLFLEDTARPFTFRSRAPPFLP